jgi:phosphoribosyl-ATP pyrophosphohydrolase/phosphoribosyl-AMP cyclohydrolase
MIEALGSLDPDALAYDERGLLPVVAQDVATGAVLMVAWADRAAVARTAETGFACFYSRSRRAPWMKGETSGNRLRVVEVREDCDRDTLLLRVYPEGPACHRGTRTCFESEAGPPNPARLELGWLWEILERRREASPEESYTARLLAAGPERIAQKVGEEGVETALAAVTRDGDGVVEEAADLLYHLLTLLLSRGIEPERVSRALARRHREREA